LIVSSCSSNTKSSGAITKSSYCTPGDRLGSCTLRNTYRRVLNLFPDWVKRTLSIFIQSLNLKREDRLNFNLVITFLEKFASILISSLKERLWFNEIGNGILG